MAYAGAATGRRAPRPSHLSTSVMPSESSSNDANVHAFVGTVGGDVARGPRLSRPGEVIAVPSVPESLILSSSFSRSFSEVSIFASASSDLT